MTDDNDSDRRPVLPVLEGQKEEPLLISRRWHPRREMRSHGRHSPARPENDVEDRFVLFGDAELAKDAAELELARLHVRRRRHTRMPKAAIRPVAAQCI